MNKAGDRYSFYSNLVAARIKKGISQAELAAMVGLQRSNLCRIEKGNQNISVDLLFRLADALDMDISVEFKERRPLIRSPRHQQALNYALERIRRSRVAPFLEELYLYGSCARGEEKSGSDVDIFIQLSPDFKDHSELKKDMMLLKSEASSPEILKPEADLKFVIGSEWKENKLPFYRNVNKDGKRIWL